MDSSDKIFFGSIVALFVLLTGHPIIALIIFFLSVA